MSATIYNWIVVFSDGTTRIVQGETPSYALDEIEYSEQYSIVAVIRNGFDW